jgi:penicillin amidase
VVNTARPYFAVARIRSHGLFRNLRQEAARALTIRDFGLEAEKLRRHLEPPHELTIPDGLDLSLIPGDVLTVYDYATTPPPFPPQAAPATAPPAPPEGSNNWVVAAHRTATRRPVLASDPHRAVSLPSLRYLAHLSTPGFDVIGRSAPA